MCVALVVNTRPGPPRWIGHAMIDKPGWEAGVDVIGYSYGWPWNYRTVSFKHDDVPFDAFFDRFDWSALAANVAVALGGSAAIAWLAEQALKVSVRRIRLVLRPMATRGLTGDRQ